MDTVIKQGTIVTASYLHEAICARGHYVFAGDLDTTAHLPGEKDVGAGAGAPAGQSTIRWQED
jgi:formylmethanofuran dehydrogenase subunit A